MQHPGAIAWQKCDGVDRSRLSDWAYCEAFVAHRLIEANERSEATKFRIIQFTWCGLSYNTACSVQAGVDGMD
ncbi:MAG: hypothetical protein ABIR91_05445 [Candidatus Saccharimonadales bacterium]